MKLFVFLFVLILLSMRSIAQPPLQRQLRGRVCFDEEKCLDGATVRLLQYRDSMVVASSFTGRTGEFVLSDIPEGKLLLHVAYLGFVPLFLPVSIDDRKKNIDLGIIRMREMYLALPEISVVGSRRGVRVTEDTVEFRTNYFKLREYSALEDLLRKLPGVQVDNDGTIRVNGEIVKTVLVDGRPLLGDNSSKAIRNLQMEIVEGIQLIDRRVKERDPSSFSTIETEKAINIIINKKKKNLWTGNLMLGIGLDNKFATKGTLSRFGNDWQVTHLSEGDNINSYQNGGAGGGVGIIRKWSSNTNFTKDLSRRISIGLTYLVDNSHNSQVKYSSRENFVSTASSDDSSYLYQQYFNDIGTKASHVVNTEITFRVDSSLTMIYGGSFNFNTMQDELYSSHSVNASKMQLVDSGIVSNRGNSKNSMFSNSVSLEKKIGSMGRAVSFKLAYSIYGSSENLYNISNTTFSTTTDPSVNDSINQFNTASKSSKSVQFVFVYTQPVFKKIFLVSSYGFTAFNNPSNKRSFSYNSVTEKYDRVNDSLTGNYKSFLTSHYGRIGIQSKAGKYSYDVSVVIASNIIKSDIVLNNTQFKQSNIAILPRFNFNYSFSKSKRVKFSLITSPLLPSIEELGVLPDNSNPLIIKVGNPALKAGNLRRFSLSYYAIDAESMRDFGLNFSGAMTENKIVNSTWIDSLNRQIVKPINMNGAYEFRFIMNNGFYFPKKIGSLVSISSLNFKRDVNSINDAESINLNLYLSQFFKYTYNYKDGFDFYCGTNIDYYRIVYLRHPKNVISYYSYGASSGFSIGVPFGFLLTGDANFSLNTGRGKDFNTSFLMLNTSLSKPVFAKRGLVKLQGFDLLDQNKGVDRFIGPGYIEDSRADVLKRFFLLSFTYFLTREK